MTDPISISWLSDALPVSSGCPICGGDDAAGIAILDAPAADVQGLQYNRCKACRSIYPDGGSVVATYPDGGSVVATLSELDQQEMSELDQQEAAEAIYLSEVLYIDIGAGISSLIGLLRFIDLQGKKTFLDVGCGFGFIVDFWRRILGGSRSVGLELGDYGRTGKELLKAEIYQSYADDCEEIAGESFDVVLSSEVIEHVTYPRRFIADLRNFVAEDGVMIITTPSADALTKGVSHIDAYAALHPTGHHFVLSKFALESILKDAGFRGVQVITVGLQLIAIVSHQPDIVVDSQTKSAKEGFRSYHLESLTSEYLELLASDVHPKLKGAGLYRLFSDATNRGRLDEANRWYRELDTLLREHHGICINDFPVERILATSEAAQHVKAYPAWLGCALYYMGMYISHTDPDNMRKKLRVFDAASRILQREISVFRGHHKEASVVLPLAVFHFLQSACHVILREGSHHLMASMMDGHLMDRFDKEMAKLKVEADHFRSMHSPDRE